METKTRYLQYPLILFFIFILSAGEVAFISFASMFRPTSRFESHETSFEALDPASLVQLWYDPLEPENPMIIHDGGRKVLWQGVMYSVVSIVPSGEDVLYLCMTDNGETYVESNAVSVSQQHSNPEKERLKGKVLLGQFIYREALISLRCPYFDQYFAGWAPRIKNYSPEISPPPPRFC